MAEGQPKVCVICKQDCSTRPHVKDKQGRYACRACVEKKQAKTAAAKAPQQPQTGGADPVMARLVEGSVAVKSTPCPQCSNPIPPDGIVCTNCGFNTQTGKATRTHVAAPEKEKGIKTPKVRTGPGIGELISGNGGVALGLLVVLGLGTAAFVDETFMLVYLIVLGLYSITYQVMVIVTAFLDDHQIWGALGIASFIVPFIGLAMLFYVLFINARGALKMHLLILIIGGILLGVAIAQGGLDLGGA